MSGPRRTSPRGSAQASTESPAALRSTLECGKKTVSSWLQLILVRPGDDPEVIEQSPQSTEFAQIWQAADKVDFSRTLEAVHTSRTQLRSRFDPEEAAHIKADAQCVVTIDGPTLT